MYQPSFVAQQTSVKEIEKPSYGRIKLTTIGGYFYAKRIPTYKVIRKRNIGIKSFIVGQKRNIHKIGFPLSDNVFLSDIFSDLL